MKKLSDFTDKELVTGIPILEGMSVVIMDKLTHNEKIGENNKPAFLKLDSEEYAGVFETVDIQAPVGKEIRRIGSAIFYGTELKEGKHSANWRATFMNSEAIVWEPLEAARIAWHKDYNGGEQIVINPEQVVIDLKLKLKI